MRLGIQTKDILSRKEAADHLTAMGFPVAPRTLARLAAKRQGPPYVRFLWRIVTYKRADVEAWARSESVVAGGPPVRG